MIELGAVPITFSDGSGHIYEPSGFDLPKLRNIQRLKQERGVKIGRYIMASTSAKFCEPENIYSIPCDFVFACSNDRQVDEKAISDLSANGCQGIIEGTQQAMTPAALVAAKKKGFLLGPYRATTAGASLVNGLTITE